MAIKPLNNEKELLAKIAEGDERAFTEIFDHYWKKLLAIAFNHTKDKSDAEEIVQEVFIALWNKRAILEIRTLDRYLATATKFTVFSSYYRKKKRIEGLINSIEFTEHYDMEDQIAARFLQEQIDGIVSTLPEKCRLVFEYSRVAGMKISEIATEMGISEKTVEAHLTKALKTIKGGLSDTSIVLVALWQLLEK
jgi:RNA polymerase sigma-70 factor (family 1)